MPSVEEVSSVQVAPLSLVAVQVFSLYGVQEMAGAAGSAVFSTKVV
jgi:hypothetical protein